MDNRINNSQARTYITQDDTVANDRLNSPKVSLDKGIFNQCKVTKLEGKIKTYIVNQENQPIRIAEKAKDTIPKCDEADVQKIVPLRGRRIGEGSFGAVYLATQNPENRTNFSPLYVQKRFTSIKSKAQNHAKMEHINMQMANELSLYDKDKNTIASKYKGVSLNNLINRVPKKKNIPLTIKKFLSKIPSFFFKKHEINSLSETEINSENKLKINMSYQILDKLSKLHSKGIIHQDIKLENMVVSAGGEVSIIDLGGIQQNSKKKQISKHKYPMIISTPKYWAPEAFTSKDRKVTQAFDCWSAGIAIAELFTENLKSSETFIKKDNNRFYFDNKAFDIFMTKEINNNKNIPNGIKALINKMLKVDPSKRLKASRALKYNIFKDQIEPQKDTLAYNIKHDKELKKLIMLEYRAEATEKLQEAEIKMEKLQKKLREEKVKKNSNTQKLDRICKEKNKIRLSINKYEQIILKNTDI